MPSKDELQDFVLNSLEAISNTFADVLDTQSQIAIDNAKASVTQSKSLYDKNKRRTDDPKLVLRPWGFAITHDAPIRFKRVEYKKHDLVADIVCRYFWEDSFKPTSQELILRIWNKSLAYREHLDHDSMLDVHTNPDGYGRVMLRCHFDLANPGQDGPKYHLQYGGNARADELCWIPEELKIPRIAFSPIDIVLACQMIVANFFSDEYQEKYKRDRQWVSVVTDVQKKLLREYYDQCVKVIDNDRILLDDLWN